MKKIATCKSILLPIVLLVLLFNNRVLALEDLVLSDQNPINIDAEHGITCEEEHQRCFVKNGVRVEQEGITLHANSLTTLFSGATREAGIKEIIAEGNVSMSTKEGYRLKSDQIHINLEEKTMTVKGSAIELYYDQFVLKANNQLHYVQARNTLKCENKVSVKDDRYILESDIVFAHFAKDATGHTRLDKLISPHDCIISTPHEYIEAKHGTFDAGKKEIRLKGDVIVTRDNGQLRGDLVKVDLASGTAQITRHDGRAQLLIIPEKREKKAHEAS